MIMLRMNSENTSPVDGKTSRRKTDWDAVERDYRTGKFTLRELEAKHGVFNTSIARKAKKDGWKQDLSEAIRQETNNRLAESLVSEIVSDGLHQVRATVSSVAEVNAKVILGHRVGLNRITRIQDTLLDQIEQAAQNLPELVEAIEMLRKPDENGIDKANDAMKKAMSRSSIVDDLKKLAEINERVRKGEREAFGITSESGPADGQAQKRVLLEFVDAVIK